MSTRRRFALLAAFVAPVACTSTADLTSQGGDSGPGDGEGGGEGDGAADQTAPDVRLADTSTAADSSPGTDANGEADVIDAGDDGNLLTNGGFEKGAAGCQDWIGYALIGVRSTNAHTGKAACLVCVQPPATGYFSLESAPIPVKAGSTYHGEVWLSAPPSGPIAGATGVDLVISTLDGGFDMGQGTPLTPGSAWASSSVTYTVPDDGQMVFAVRSLQPDGGCVLVDDAVLDLQ
jgi:hypothetical protein